MKTMKYGYSRFNKKTELRFAVMVPVYAGDKTLSWRFVTDVQFSNKTWMAENHKPAFLFNTRQGAQDFCIGLAYNFTAGYVVEVLEGMEVSNNW